MRIIIVPSDGFVSVNGEGHTKIDLSFMDSNIHALQWYGTNGEIERCDERNRIIINEEITDFSSFQPALDAWKMAVVKEAEKIAAIEAVALEEYAQYQKEISLNTETLSVNNTVTTNQGA